MSDNIIYTVESDVKRADIESLNGHFRIFYGQGGEWLKTYRVANSFEKAKMFADEWIASTGTHFLDRSRIVS